MEVSLFTGANIILSIVDSENGNITHYLSDPIEKCKEMCQVAEMKINNKLDAKDENNDES